MASESYHKGSQRPKIMKVFFPKNHLILCPQTSKVFRTKSRLLLPTLNSQIDQRALLLVTFFEEIAFVPTSPWLRACYNFSKNTCFFSLSWMVANELFFYFPFAGFDAR